MPGFARKTLVRTWWPRRFFDAFSRREPIPTPDQVRRRPSLVNALATRPSGTKSRASRRPGPAPGLFVRRIRRFRVRRRSRDRRAPAQSESPRGWPGRACRPLLADLVLASLVLAGLALASLVLGYPGARGTRAARRRERLRLAVGTAPAQGSLPRRPALPENYLAPPAAVP